MATDVQKDLQRNQSAQDRLPDESLGVPSAETANLSEEKINILVVDDVPEKLLAMRAVLEELGQNVIAVSSGRDALRQVLERDFAVILLDVNMPDLDGFETAALIRQRKRSEHIPVIFVTAYGDDAHAWHGYSLGAVDYILAPVVPDVLRAKVAVFVELFRKTQQIRRHADERVVLAREQAARAAAEEAMHRSAFLAAASIRLSSSLDYDSTINAVAAIMLPMLADRLLLCLSGEPGSPRKLESIGELPGGPSPESISLLPLVAHGKLLGSLALVRSGQRAGMSSAEYVLVQELAARTAVAIDNARLYSTVRENDRRKDEFLAMLSHELRNPLAAMTSALDCLDLAGSDVSAAKDARTILRRQSQRVTRMLDDLLDVSRITRGTIQLRKSRVDLADVIGSAVVSTRSEMEAHRVRLDILLPIEPVRLVADSTRLEQILVNLLNNAAKYTEPGGEIQLMARAAHGELVIRVRDTGIGMTPELLRRAFDLFAQGDRPLDRTQGGLGIGLTVVRRLVEMHDGMVSASSEGVGRGSTFTVRLPLGNWDEMVPVATPSPPPASVVGKRVLVVDDNVDIAATTSALLRRAGYAALVAYDGHSAIDLVADNPCDAVLIDIGLPEIDGYEVARRLIDLCGERKPLLIAITGYGQEEDIDRSCAAGFDHHLVKPVDFASLLQILAGGGQGVS